MWSFLYQIYQIYITLNKIQSKISFKSTPKSMQSISLYLILFLSTSTIFSSALKRACTWVSASNSLVISVSIQTKVQIATSRAKNKLITLHRGPNNIIIRVQLPRNSWFSPHFPSIYFKFRMFASQRCLFSPSDSHINEPIIDSNKINHKEKPRRFSKHTISINKYLFESPLS